MSILSTIFKQRYTSLSDMYTIADPGADKRTGKRVGQYTISPNAIYRPDGFYMPINAIESITHDKSSIHLNGC